MKRLQRTIRFSAFVFSLIVTASLATQVGEAATYFVAQTGSNAYTCSQSQSDSTPRRTISAGLSCLASGDTLQVGSGTYAESIFSINGSSIPNGSPLRYTRIVGTGKVFLAPTSSEPALSAGIYLGGSASYIEFDGIGGDGVNHTSLNWPGCCGLVLGGTAPGSIHHIRLLNGEFKNNKCGSMGFGKASDVDIIGNYLHDDQCNSFSHGLYLARTRSGS